MLPFASFRTEAIMTIHTKHDPGMFSWTDLTTTDQAGAKKFYGALFGWTTNDMPMGEGTVYSMCKLGQHDAAGIAPMSAREKEMHVPPHWTCFFTVKDVDATAAKVEPAGGKLLAPPFDVMDVGRMAVVADAAGGVLAMWTPKKHIGAGVTNEPGAITWAEELTRNVDASGKLWTALFGWKADAMPMPNGVPYTVFKVGDAPSCGMMAMPAQVPQQVPSHWLPYFQVADCDATLKKATEMGGKVLMPAMEVPDVGRFATLADPQGAVFAVLQSKR
jgi:predicted enzyme related to lactoylglutathione lyase